MAIGIWTPVAGSNLRVVFDTTRPTFADLKKSVAPVAGTHLLIVPEGCELTFYSATEPATEAAAYQGTPIPKEGLVVPRTAAAWIFCPGEMQVVNISVGALT